MSGFKNTVLGLKPKTMITFDGDAYDPVSRLYTEFPSVILDESGLENHGFMQGVNKRGYRAGIPSLTELEKIDQCSTSFGYYGRQVTDPDTYPISYLEIPHTTDFNFPDGSFSVLWLQNKESNDSAYRTDNPLTPGGTLTANLERPIFEKSGVVSAKHVYRHSATSTVEFSLPGGKSMVWSIPSKTGLGAYHGQDRLMCLTWRIFRDNFGNTTGTATFYIDGEEMVSESFPYFDAYPSIGYATSWIVGASLNPAVYHSNVNTSALTIDCFTVFDYAIDVDSLSRLFKKSFSYQSLVKKMAPLFYFEFDDPDLPDVLNPKMTVPASGMNYMKINGPVGSHARELDGPDTIPGSKSMSLNGAQLIYYATGGAMFQTQNDYTVEFWFTATGDKPGSLFSMAGPTRPYHGLQISLNLYNNAQQTGAIQVQENEDTYSSISGNFADGFWHKITVVRRGERVEVWIDGQMRSNLSMPKATATTPSAVSLFASQAGRLNVNGQISHLAIYQKALGEAQIKARDNYNKIYKIRGNVTLRGTPHQANVRAYSNFNGELIKEVISDSNGEYMFNLVDGRLVDLLVVDTRNPTIRYRAYGPITPSQYDDV